MFSFLDIAVIVACYFSLVSAGAKELTNEELYKKAKIFLIFFKILFIVSLFVLLPGTNNVEGLKIFLYSIFCYLIYIINIVEVSKREQASLRETLLIDTSGMLQKKENKEENK